MRFGGTERGREFLVFVAFVRCLFMYAFWESLFMTLIFIIHAQQYSATCTVGVWLEGFARCCLDYL